MYLLTHWVKPCVFLFFYITGISCAYSQIEFEKGYVIDQNGQRIDCLIKNSDWKNNPDIIQYKMSASGEVQSGSIETLKEFQVDGYAKYVSMSVKIDRSSDETSNLSGDRAPIWSEEKLFLKMLLSGKATLLKYEATNFIRFFYSVDGTPIQQLVHKEYLKETDQSAHGTIVENNTFQQQLLNEINCGGINTNQVKAVKYTETDLVKYFRKYNACRGGDGSETAEQKQIVEKRDILNLKITPGLNYSSLDVINDHSNSGVSYEKNIGFRVGVEGEFVFPFNKNKLTFLFEPTFQAIKTDIESGTGSLEFNSIDFPVGLRYYFFLNQKSKIFMNVHYVPVFSVLMNSSLKLSSNYELEIDTGDCVAFGAGTEVGRFSGELRYYASRQLTRNDDDWGSYLKSVTFMVGYKFLRIKK